MASCATTTGIRDSPRGAARIPDRVVPGSPRTFRQHRSLRPAPDAVVRLIGWAGRRPARRRGSWQRAPHNRRTHRRWTFARSWDASLNREDGAAVPINARGRRGGVASVAVVPLPGAFRSDSDRCGPPAPPVPEYAPRFLPALRRRGERGGRYGGRARGGPDLCRADSPRSGGRTGRAYPAHPASVRERRQESRRAPRTGDRCRATCRFHAGRGRGRGRRSGPQWDVGKGGRGGRGAARASG